MSGSFSADQYNTMRTVQKMSRYCYAGRARLSKINMELSDNEIQVIKLLRSQEAFTSINIFKKGAKDQTEYRIEVQRCVLLRRDLDKKEEALL